MSDYDGMDYEELLGECEWMSDFLSMMAERITKNPDVHNLVDYVRKIEDENARLRSCLSDDAENARMIMGENDKLREQLYYERQTSRSRLEGIDRLKKENEKLRKLVRELWGRDAGLYCSIDGTCRDPLCKQNGECSLDNRMRELGIEVVDG